jgi:hypothetical protein
MIMAHATSRRTSMKAFLRFSIMLTAAAAALCFHIPESRAFGSAPWCAVVSVGTGAVIWDCQYRSIEECVPNVLAGNRGFCNVNPAWQGPAEPRKPRRRH